MSWEIQSDWTKDFRSKSEVAEKAHADVKEDDDDHC